MNQTAYMILPLTGLNTRKWGVHFSPLENVYLSPSMKTVVAHFSSPVAPTILSHSYARHWFGPHNDTLMEFHIPSRFWPDVNLFKLGKYRKMSDVAKGRIISAIEVVVHPKRVAPHVVAQQEIDMKMHPHLSVHVMVTGKHRVVLVPPHFAGLAPANSDIYRSWKSQLEKKLGTNLANNSELLSPPDISREIIPKDYYNLRTPYLMMMEGPYAGKRVTEDKMFTSGNEV